MQLKVRMKLIVINLFILNLILSTKALCQVDRTLLIKALQDELIARGDLSSKPVSPITPSPTPTPEMSRGEQIIEEQKRKVREEIARRNQKQVVAEKDSTKSLIDEHKSWLSNLRDEHLKTLNEWKELNRVFVKRIPEVKKHLEDSSIFKNVSKISPREIIETNIVIPQENILIDDGSLKVVVKDQGNRPTCSAFAGVVLIEALLQKNNVDFKVSPEYMYYASKPDCQNAPCSTIGSWIGYGFEHSQKKNGPDIPSEQDCQYLSNANPNNQTNLPISSLCKNGVVQIKKFRYLATMDEAYKELQQGKSLFMSLKLSENFYDNQGMIYFSEANQGKVKLDSHSKGHAVVLVGAMPLPEKVHTTEGKLCWIIKNSWGKGWGRGGYSCLSDKWLSRYRSTNPMVVLDEISHRDRGVLK